MCQDIRGNKNIQQTEQLDYQLTKSEEQAVITFGYIFAVSIENNTFWKTIDNWIIFDILVISAAGENQMETAGNITCGSKTELKCLEAKKS